jgi:ketosteroid isomerase-like protein
MSDQIAEQLICFERDWGRAMVGNDAPAIGQFMADDWTIIGPDGSVCDKATFLELVSSGALTHDVMDFEDVKVRVYGDTAVLTFRGVSGGQYHGQAFRVVERVSDVHVKQAGEWKCVLTHLSRIAENRTD